jgi:nucleotide-binding universal stress UspA family protein
VVRYAREQRCSLIAMGTRGMGSVANLLLGSVATKVIGLSGIPVLLVK